MTKIKFLIQPQDVVYEDTPIIEEFRSLPTQQKTLRRSMEASESSTIADFTLLAPNENTRKIPVRKASKCSRKFLIAASSIAFFLLVTICAIALYFSLKQNSNSNENTLTIIQNSSNF